MMRSDRCSARVGLLLIAGELPNFWEFASVGRFGGRIHHSELISGRSGFDHGNAAGTHRAVGSNN